MNDVFYDIGKKLSDKIPATLNPFLANEYFVKKENSMFHFTLLDTCQVEKVFGKLKLQTYLSSPFFTKSVRKVGL